MANEYFFSGGNLICLNTYQHILQNATWLMSFIGLPFLPQICLIPRAFLVMLKHITLDTKFSYNCVFAKQTNGHLLKDLAGQEAVLNNKYIDIFRVNLAGSC